MAYIGNGRTLLVVGSNVRDDIVPTGDKKTFVLSQEVPGGYGQNVLVFRQRYIVREVLTNTTLVTIESLGNGTGLSKLVCSNASAAAALSSIKEPTGTYTNSGHKIIISGSSITALNEARDVTDVSYDGQTIEITFKSNLTHPQSSGETLSISHGFVGFWETLDPESDYLIEGSGDLLNRQITFNDTPIIGDRIYVVHKGDATYNLVPAQNSVGPEQLQDNLRNFTCDRFVADGTQTTYTLSQKVAHARSLLVTVDGIIQENDEDAYGVVGDWELIQPVNLDTGLPSIQFNIAPGANKKIRVLHLGFSTSMKRWAFSPGQIDAVPLNSIGTPQLANGAVTSDKLATDSVITSKIANNAVDGSKILLNNNEFLNARDTSGNKTGLLRLTSSNLLELQSPSSFLFSVNGTPKLTISDSGETVINSDANGILVNTKVRAGTFTRFSNDTSGATIALQKSRSATLSQTESVVAGDILGGVYTKGANGTAYVDGFAVLAVADQTPTSSSTTIPSHVSVYLSDNDQGTLDERIRITSSGNVGLSTLTPTERLDVNGKVKANDVVTPSINGITMEDLVASLMPVGTLIQSASLNVPNAKWLFCDGRAVSRTSYASLFTAIGTRFGIGDGSTTFNIPDLRRRIPIGASDVSTSSDVGQNEGIATHTNRTITHTHSGAPHTHDLKNHTHSLPGHGHELTETSTLQISASSGNHDTSISHTHYRAGTTSNQFTTDGNSGHRHYSSDALSGLTLPANETQKSLTTQNNPAGSLKHSHNISHNHGLKTGDKDLNHRHSISLTTTGQRDATLTANGKTHAHPAGTLVTGSGDAHYHKLYYNNVTVVSSVGNTNDGVGVHYNTTSIQEVSGSSGNDGFNMSARDYDDSAGTIAGHTHTVTGSTGNNDADHVHLFSGYTVATGTQYASNIALNGTVDLNHSHTITAETGDSGFPKMTGIADATANELYHTHAIIGQTAFENLHTHTVTIPGHTGNSTSNGTHTHPSNSFSGFIGNGTNGVINLNGNNIMTSGVPSDNNTGAAVYTGETGAATSPYLIISYFIKAL